MYKRIGYRKCRIDEFVIGFVGGMVGLVLGVVRFPLVMSVETSVSITAGTNATILLIMNQMKLQTATEFLLTARID